MRAWLARGYLILLVLQLGCAGVGTRQGSKALEKLSAAEVLLQIQNIGSSIASARGEVWMKVRSSDASGQFPASVVVKDQDSLILQITNLIGGTEAVIHVDGSKYRIEVPDKKERNETGAGSWGGIPLEWATRLFLGRVPAPKDPNLVLPQSLVWDLAKMQLTVEVGADLSGGSQRFVYVLKNWGHRIWPESLTWERQSALITVPPTRVEFKFEDPDETTLSPKRWEATSSRGQVKVRWKVREQIDR